MILPFSTQLNGKPTYFVEKIWKCLKNIDFETYAKIEKILSEEELTQPYEIDYNTYKNVYPKRHTIREDKKNRWKPGSKIDFFINCRQKNMFRFAPVLPVVSVQEIEIKYTDPDGFRWAHPEIYINNKVIDPSDWELLAQNDGFDTYKELFAYFNKDFKGKIIHWTNLKY